MANGVHTIWYKEEAGAFLAEDLTENEEAEFRECGYQCEKVLEDHTLDQAQKAFTKWVQVIQPEAREERINFFELGTQLRAAL